MAFNCNKTIGVLFWPKKYKQPAPSNVFLNVVCAHFFDHVKYLGMWINASQKDDDDIQRQVKSLYYAANKLRGTFNQCTSAVKKLYFVPIACQCMFANCGGNTHRLVQSTYMLHIMPTKSCITYIPRNKDVHYGTFRVLESLFWIQNIESCAGITANLWSAMHQCTPDMLQLIAFTVSGCLL